MEKFNYAVAKLRVLAPAKASEMLLKVLFPVKDDCVDYGSHRHLPDSMAGQTNSPSRNQD